MTCSRCPSACLTCINSDNCTTCKSGLYLHIGQCLTDCPTFPVYYYKYDPAFACQANCTYPYFAFKGTGKCEQTCPATFYSYTVNSTSQCLSCPTGCSACIATNCSSCLSGYIFVSKYRTCSKKCSVNQAFFLSKGCVSSCPGGTFLLDDLVTCQKCNPICSECYAIASNCTKCQGTFWYNYNCVTECPSNYYVGPNNFCLQCADNPSACALPPLNYTLSMETTKNYKLIAYVTFNRAVNLTKA